MPKFEVLLRFTSEELLTLEVSARDEEAAVQRVNEAVQSLNYNKEKIAKKYKNDWEFDSENIDVEEVTEL